MVKPGDFAPMSWGNTPDRANRVAGAILARAVERVERAIAAAKPSRTLGSILDAVEDRRPRLGVLTPAARVWLLDRGLNEKRPLYVAVENDVAWLVQTTHFGRESSVRVLDSASAILGAEKLLSAAELAELRQ